MTSGPADAVDHQYATSANLTSRMSLHERYGSNLVRWQPWVFDQLGLKADERVLEAGCGPGALWRENRERIPAVRLTLTDRSTGMTHEARASLPAGVAFAVVDVQALPFADAAFDVAIANHMLYHVDDLDRALSELRRVLKPGGRLFAATNGAAHMRQSLDLATRHLGYSSERSIVGDFTLESGLEPLRRHFAAVRVLRPPVEPLRVTEVEPLLDYIRSIGPYPSAPDAAWQALAAEVTRAIATKGHFEITRESGLFVASASA